MKAQCIYFLGEPGHRAVLVEPSAHKFFLVCRVTHIWHVIPKI